MSDTATFEVTPLRNANVQYLYSRRSEIDMDPPYQRQGAVWSTEKKQLLIDSIINQFDVPKIYLHQFPAPKRIDGVTVRYALVDGKQRLEAVFGFLDGEFTLSGDFVRLSDGSQAAAGKTFNELVAQDPLLVSDLQATVLDVVTIRTDDVELIEEMFSRLNEAVPLNAAEKRNALGGPLPVAARALIEHSFFSQKVPFTNRRYRHLDLAAKFLYWEHIQTLDPAAAVTSGAPGLARDVKKVRLDRFFRDLKEDDDGAAKADMAKQGACGRLSTLSGCFIDNDALLQSVGMISVYYLLALKRGSDGVEFPSRSTLLAFDKARRVNPGSSEGDLKASDLVLLEFARLAQSPNDAAALNYRLWVLDTWLKASESGADPREALAPLYESLED